MIVDIYKDFIALSQLNNTFEFDLRYATTNNIARKVIYPKAGCYLRKPAACALDGVQKELNQQGLGLKIFDAYRPLRYQKLFWDIMPDERYVAHPEKGSKHNRGAAVDVTLIDFKTKKELLMPSEFDDLSERAHRNYETMHPDAARNCMLLETIMKRHGFDGWAQEWWHFDYKDWQHYPLEDISFEELEEQKNI